jgi:putative inorganic carbon (HCO3(-)) transporter
MRDIVIVTIVALGVLIALRRPWVGLLLWVWLSIMNPHRFAFGFAYSAPLAQVTVAAIALGMVVTRDRLRSPFVAGPATWFIVLTLWITITWALGLDPKGDWDQWTKVMKINVMVVMAVVLVHTKQQIMGLATVLVGSMGLLGLKGGLYTLATGGGGRVWGPPGSFIADNNDFACALVMTIPLLRFLQLQVQHRWWRHVYTALILLCVTSVIGSQSRGGLLAMAAMGTFFWWKSKAKVRIGLVLALMAVVVLLAVPESWMQRMQTIDDYQTDQSALGRLNAWWMAWNLVKDYPLGIGMNTVRPELFALYSPYPEKVFAAHSIYFQMLGNHGYLGVLLFVGIWWSTWRCAADLIRMGERNPEQRWLSDLGTMAQVSVLTYLVGGIFLSLAYFDLPYYTMTLVVVARLWAHNAKLQAAEPQVPAWQAHLGWGKAAPVAVRKRRAA